MSFYLCICFAYEHTALVTFKCTLTHCICACVYTCVYGCIFIGYIYISIHAYQNIQLKCTYLTFLPMRHTCTVYLDTFKQSSSFKKVLSRIDSGVPRTRQVRTLAVPHMRRDIIGTGSNSWLSGCQLLQYGSIPVNADDSISARRRSVSFAILSTSFIHFFYPLVPVNRRECVWRQADEGCDLRACVRACADDMSDLGTFVKRFIT